MSEQSSPQTDTKDVKANVSRRSPLVSFLGFMLLGAALALVLFGGNLLGGGPAASEPILEQIAVIPTVSGSTGAALTRASRPSGILQVGDEAYNFTLEDLDGEPVSLADFRGRPVIVNFWATWCAPCRIEMPELQEAYDTYQEEGLVILALDQDEPAEVARAYFYDEMGLTFTPLLDQNSATATAFGSYGVLPTSYFIDGGGKITAIHRGPMTLGQIEGYLSETPATGS